MPSTHPYDAARAIFVRTVDGLEDHTPVPACSAWDVHDLLAHQVHQLAGARDRTFPVRAAHARISAPTARERQEAAREQERWIGAGLTARRSLSTAQLVAEWEDETRRANEAVLDALLPDVVTHVFDLLGAAGDRGHRGEAFVATALEGWREQSTHRLEAHGCGPLRLGVVDHGVALGPVDAPVAVEGSGFELLRTLTGRRTRRQADRLRWTGGNATARDQLSVYGWRERDLAE